MYKERGTSLPLETVAHNTMSRNVRSLSVTFEDEFESVYF